MAKELDGRIDKKDFLGSAVGITIIAVFPICTANVSLLLSWSQTAPYGHLNTFEGTGGVEEFVRGKTVRGIL